MSTGLKPISTLIASIVPSEAPADTAVVKRVADGVKELCSRYPVYGPAMKASYGYSPSPRQHAA